MKRFLPSLASIALVAIAITALCFAFPVEPNAALIAPALAGIVGGASFAGAASLPFLIGDMAPLTKQIQTLRSQRTTLMEKAAANMDLSIKENRVLTADELAKNKDFETQLGTLDESIAAMERRADRERAAAGLPRVVVTTDEGDKPFATMGHFLQAVAESYDPGANPDPRLAGPRAAATGHSAGVGADGGFLVRQEFSTALLESAREESMLLPFCRQQPIGDGFDGIELPYIKDDDRSGGNVYGGVQVYRRAEASTVTATAAKMEALDIRLQDLMGITYVTGRLLQDAVAMESFIMDAFATAFGFRIDDEILNGTGAGQMLGVLNSANAALITISKETGQAADTVLFENVKAMRARMPARNRRKAVWIANATVEPQLQSMYMAIGTGGVPVYMPANGVQDDAFDRLYGRPVIPIEHAPAVGDAGDLSFLDLSQYMVIGKGGMDVQESIHVRFLYDEKAFRFMVRNNGRPTWRTVRTPKKGATLSPFVTLEAR